MAQISSQESLELKKQELFKSVQEYIINNPQKNGWYTDSVPKVEMTRAGKKEQVSLDYWFHISDNIAEIATPDATKDMFVPVGNVSRDKKNGTILEIKHKPQRIQHSSLIKIFLCFQFSCWDKPDFHFLVIFYFFFHDK